MKESIIITGSKGLIGTEITKHFKKTHKVYELDLELGHDLTDELFVNDWFSQNNANYLVNCFGMNDHITKYDNDNKSTKIKSNISNNDIFNVSLISINEYLNINVVALFSVCREFAKNSKSSAIINFASTYAQVSPIPAMYSQGEKHIGYSVSKGAVLQLTRHLAVHLSSRNIRVNCVVPGGIELEQSEEFVRKYNKKVPIGRMMKKNELNGLISYLCSDESSYMTGSIINIDGGWTSW